MNGGDSPTSFQSSFIIPRLKRHRDANLCIFIGLRLKANKSVIKSGVIFAKLDSENEKQSRFVLNFKDV